MCPAVYLYDKMRNKKKRHYIRMAVLWFLLSPCKRKGKKEKSYYNPGYSYLITHPCTSDLTDLKSVSSKLSLIRNDPFSKLSGS